MMMHLTGKIQSGFCVRESNMCSLRVGDRDGKMPSGLHHHFSKPQ